MPLTEAIAEVTRTIGPATAGAPKHPGQRPPRPKRGSAHASAARTVSAIGTVGRPISRDSVWLSS